MMRKTRNERYKKPEGNITLTRQGLMPGSLPSTLIFCPLPVSNRPTVLTLVGNFLSFSIFILYLFSLPVSATVCGYELDSYTGCSGTIANVYACFRTRYPDRDPIGECTIPGGFVSVYTADRFYGTSDGGNVECTGQTIRNEFTGACDNLPSSPSKDKQQGCQKTTGTSVGNPCNPANGNKYESVTDYRGTGLSFTRSYNSLVAKDGDLGFGWSGNRYRRLEFSSATQIMVRHADGKGDPFSKTNGNWVGDSDTDRVLRETTGGYTVDLPDGRTEQYDTAGKLISETDRNGQITTYTYDSANKLTTVTGPYGHTLQFVYDANAHLTSLTDPNGKIITYSYDAQNNLSTVSYPDGGQRIYHYENVSFSHHLTGITDENGDRYSTFAYDSVGRAIFTGHAQTDNGAPQEGFSLDYNSWGGQ